jgi:pimeloyl-ACP methyl ester carboxylesterase
MTVGQVETRTIDGLTVTVRHWDPATNGDPASAPSPPILLVHGLGANTVSWITVGQALADRRGAQVTALDLCGFGYTRSTDTRATLNRNADLVIAALDEIGPAVVVGNSMGGSVTVKATARRPDMVDAFVLVNPAIKPAIGSPQWRNLVWLAPMVIPRVGERLLASRARQIGAVGLVDGTLEIVLEHPDLLDPAVRAHFIEIATARGEYPEAARAYVDAASSMFWYLTRNFDRDLGVALRSRRGLLVFGERDRLIDISSARALAKRHPTLDVEMLDGMGHAPQLEDPARFVDVVTTWLKKAVD